MEEEATDAGLTELGRMTRAAIVLESTVYTICRLIKPRHGPWDDCPIGKHISEALDDLATYPEDEMRRVAEAWLTEAKAALQARNAVLHSMPVTFVPMPGTTPVPGVARDWLHHFPRDKSKPMVATPLTVEGLQPIRERLSAATQGWMEIAVHPWESNPITQMRWEQQG